MRCSASQTLRTPFTDTFGAPHAQVTWQAAEAAFWEIVEEGEEPVEVLYGADLDTNALGSGFPRRGGRLGDSPYAHAPWNLNNLPAAAGEHGSMLRHLGDDVPGVTARARPCWGAHVHLGSGFWHPYGSNPGTILG